jgi:hypothetical protein
VGGFTFHSTVRGPIAWTTIGIQQRRLVLEGMVGAKAGWDVAGDSCPECMYAHITRASAIKALKAAQLYGFRNQKFLADDEVRWKSGASSREVFFSVVKGLLEELEAIDDKVIVIEDDYVYCEHPKMQSPKRRRGRKRT